MQAAWLGCLLFRGDVMDEATRQMISDACALDDAARADYEQLQARSSDDAALVYKTYDAQQRQQQAANTAHWNDWFSKSFRNHIRAFMRETLVDVLAETLSLIRAEMEQDFETKLGELKADVAILQGIVRSHNVTPIKSGDRDAA